MVFSLNSLDVFRYSVEKPHNTCTTQLVSSVVFESSYFIGSSEQNTEKEFNDLLVWPSICVWYSTNLFLWRAATVFWQSLILACLYLDKGMKKPWYQSYRKIKWEFTNSLNSTAISFVYIFMYGREVSLLIDVSL